MKRVVGGTKWWQVRGLRGYVSLSFSFLIGSDESDI